jgi:hypothetical protein
MTQANPLPPLSRLRGPYAEDIANMNRALATMEYRSAEMRKLRSIPLATSPLAELVNVRTLLRDGRHDEALNRLELALNELFPSWRAT